LTERTASRLSLALLVATIATAEIVGLATVTGRVPSRVAEAVTS
jgi:hypothetical protein